VIGDRDVLSLDFGKAVLTTYSGSFLGVGIDVPGGDDSGTGPFEARFPYGTFGRPRDPTPAPDNSSSVGCTVLFGYAGKSRHAWIQDDPRVWPKLPDASLGTWGAFADTGREDITVMVLDGTTGSFALRVPHSGAGVSRVLVDVGTPGAEEILLANGGGCEVAIRSNAAYVGDPLTAESVALAPDLISFAGSAATVLTAVAAAINALVPGTIPPGDIAALVAAAAKYNAPGAPTTQSQKLKAEPII